MLSFARRLYAAAARKRYEKYNLLDKTSVIRSHTYLNGSKIGYHSGCNSWCSVAYTNIGNYTQLGQHVSVNRRNHIYQNFMISDDIYTNREADFDGGIKEFDGYQVKIGSDVWIGDRAIILPHVEIGNGAIVAAGSVVTKSVGAYMVVGGVPAKFVKWRFPAKVRQRLEEIAWYEWPVEKVLEHKEMLQEIVGFDMEQYKKAYCIRKADLKE